VSLTFKLVAAAAGLVWSLSVLTWRDVENPTGYAAVLMFSSAYLLMYVE
jgi:hypothetical protein